jgi:hypothetical protein
MTSQEPVRMSLEFDPAAEQIAGRLYAQQGAVLTFTGWLGLLAALEAAATDLESETRRRDVRSP